MEPLRYNLFNQVHKALRAWLFEAAQQTQRTDFSDFKSGMSMVNELRHLLKAFEKHAEIENTIVFPLVESVAPFVITVFEQEHQKDHELGNKLTTWLCRYSESVTENQRMKAGFGILQHLNEFVAFNLQHMNKEETVINEMLWANFTDSVLQQVTADIVKKQSPEESKLLGKWMIKGLNDKEIKNWLNNVKSTAPDFLLDELLKIAERELSPARWEKIQKNFSELAAVAA